MAFRDWRWPQWALVICVFLLLIGGAVLVYVLVTPTAFAPQPSPEAPVPIGTLPTPIPGAPQLPPSDVERVPLTQIQGTDLDQGVDLIARGEQTQLLPVTYFPADFVNLAADGGSLNYYDRETRRFYRVDNSGAITKIGQQIFADVDNVVWAPNADDAIVEFPDSSNVRYNFETNEQITLPSHWDDFDFSPASTSLAFKSNALDPNERWLAVSDANGGSTRRIEPLGNNGDILTVDWAPNNQVIGTYTRPDGLSRSELYFLGFNGENFPLSRLNGLNFEGRWAPDGQKLLYSVAEQSAEFKPTLWVVDGSGSDMGRNRQPLQLQTWPSKCTFASASLAYCGVPTALPAGAGLIPSVANEIPDNLVKVDIAKGTVSPVAVPDEAMNVQGLQISDDGKTLFIHDRFSNAIKKILLP